jgi:hypothetical protein
MFAIFVKKYTIMKKLPYLLLLSMLISCSKSEDSPIDTAKAKAEEYVSLIRSLDPSLAKLTFDGVQEKTMTSHEEYKKYLKETAGYIYETAVAYPIADLDVSRSKLYSIRILFGSISSENEATPANIAIDDRFYEVQYKLSPKVQGGYRLVILVSKNMQVLARCANPKITDRDSTKECLQQFFGVVFNF